MRTRRDWLRLSALSLLGAGSTSIYAATPAQRRLLLFRNRPWEPSRLGTSLLAWWRTDTGLFQASDGTTPAAAGDDPVAYWADKSGNGHHVIQTGLSSKRPLLKLSELNGHASLLFDGSNDCLFSTDSITLGLYTYWMVAKRVGSTGIIYEQGPNLNTNAGSFWAVDAVNSTFTAIRRGATTSSYAALISQPIDSSVYGLYLQDFGGTGQYTDHKIYKNDTITAYTSLTGNTNNPGTGTVSDVVNFGMRNNASAACNFYVAEMGFASVLNAANRSLLGRYIASRYGIAITF